MKILCAVDGSEFSDWALEASGRLFHQSLKEVVLLHVIDDSQLKQGLKKAGSRSEKINRVIRVMEAEAKRILTHSEEKAVMAISQATTRPFASIRPVTARGHITETILKHAEKRKADLIVLGSRGLSDLKGYLMGSVSRKVLAHSPCAVLTVKTPLPELPHAVLAVDGSNASKRAAMFVRSWIPPESISLHVLSVVPEFLTDVAPKVLPRAHVKALTRPFQLRAKELVAQYRELYLKEGYEVSVETLSGDPKKIILDNLDKQKADLAILGSKGMTGPERFQMGSVSEWVAAYCPRSVLVVRPHAS